MRLFSKLVLEINHTRLFFMNWFCYLSARGNDFALPDEIDLYLKFLAGFLNFKFNLFFIGGDVSG